MTRNLRVTAAVFGIAIAVHFTDHLWRGVGASPRGVVVLGSVAAVLQVLAITAALRGHRHAPAFAVAVGLPDAIGVVAVHLLPAWSALSDSYPSHAPGVTAYSWATAVAEVVAAAAFAAAGWALLRRPALRASA
jgi:hypothetical protein